MTKRILVIDDEPDIRALIAQVLESAGYEVLLAESGQRGLELLDTSPVDLVILDIIMKDLDGWQVCERMKADARLRRIPVLLVTVRSLVSDYEERQKHLADGVLHKPFLLKDLQIMVTKLTSEDVATIS